MVFFTSDPHLGHDKDFVWKARGFNSVEEHDNAVVEYWNLIATEDDLIIVCGDMTVGSDLDRVIELIKKLNGHIELTRGNHDTDAKCKRLMEECGIKIRDSKIVRSGKWIFHIGHWPQILGHYKDNKDMPKRIAIHGHTHSTDEFEWMQYQSYNVAMDAHGCKLVSVEDVKERVRFYHNNKLFEKQENGTI